MIELYLGRTVLWEVKVWRLNGGMVSKDELESGWENCRG